MNQTEQIIAKLKEILKYERDVKVGNRTYYPAEMEKLESELQALESQESGREPIKGYYDYKEIQKENLILLVEAYQRFTKWILRHDHQIQESQRGRDLLEEIDKYESSYAQSPPAKQDEQINNKK